jgi:8-oxo-dGTP pyrophosphatase MutT (NUDIX family)
MAEHRDRFPVVVHVCLERDGRLALLKRANTGFMDGYYALPGGHQEQGESVSATAKRELQEELGVTARLLSPACVLPYRSGRHQGINFLFSCRDWDGEPVINEPELFAELVWAAPDALPEPTADWIPPALALAKSGGWYREMAWD